VEGIDETIPTELEWFALERAFTAVFRKVGGQRENKP
jgi:hypothetical protein